MEGKFFTFLKPYLDYIDAGKLFKQPFRVLYLVIAVALLLFPVYLLCAAIADKMFSYMSGGQIFVFLILWLIIAAAGWLSFQLWFNRSKKLQETSNMGDDFIATPVLTHFIQTWGEWLGSYVGIVGFLVTLFNLLAKGAGEYLFPIGGPIGSWQGLIAFPVAGLLIVIVFRCIAELIRALVAIANNTKK